MSDKITEMEQFPLKRKQLVSENISSGTSSPDIKTARLRNLVSFVYSGLNCQSKRHPYKEQVLIFVQIV